MSENVTSRKLFTYTATAIAALAYFLLAFHTERENFFQLILLVLSAAACGYYIHVKTENTIDIFWIGLIFRAVIFISVPFFSQDFYRFIWDGELIVHGMNPYAFTPNELIGNTAFQFPNKDLLFNKMGSLSAKYNSNYPPVNQVFFAAAAAISGLSLLGKMLILKLFVVLADMGIFFIGRKILTHYKLEEKQIAFYFLNPLIVIELTGNLHFEGVMLFFLLLGVYTFLHKKLFLAATFISMAIATKLVPLILLPFFIRRMTWKENLIFFGSLALLGAFTFYFCFGAENISHYLSSIALWFNNFEFNASIYFVLRAIGFAINGYNMIAVFGKILPVVSVIIIVVLAFVDYKQNRKNIFPFLSLALAAYLMCATTVHPWYIVTLVGLGVFTNFKFTLIWSILVFISYHAYANDHFSENSIALLLEYIPVYLLAAMEVTRYLKNREPEFTTKRV